MAEHITIDNLAALGLQMIPLLIGLMALAATIRGGLNRIAEALERIANSSSSQHSPEPTKPE